MIKLVYDSGSKAGTSLQSWENVNDFCRDTIEAVAMVAYENKLDQKSVFTHYGYEVVTTAAGENGFKNGFMGSMNFWLDTVPNVSFSYDGGTEQPSAREKAFYELLNRIGGVPGMQRMRTSSRLWNLYNELLHGAQEPLKLWEPTVEHHQELLRDYPRVGALLQVGGYLASDKERESRVAAWAFMELLEGAGVEPTLQIFHDVITYKNAPMPAQTREIPQDLFAALYAFLEGRFYHELQLEEH